MNLTRTSAEIEAGIAPVEIAELHMLRGNRSVTVDGVVYTLTSRPDGFMATSKSGDVEGMALRRTITDALIEADYLRRAAR